MSSSQTIQIGSLETQLLKIDLGFTHLISLSRSFLPRNPLLEKVPDKAENVQTVRGGLPRRQGGVQGTLHYRRVQRGVLIMDPVRRQYGASPERATGVESQSTSGALLTLLPSL